MSAGAADPNLHVYNAPEVVAHYAALNYLTACEQVLFQTFLKKGMAVLDLGVGGGRTTPYLSSIAARYVGADYAEEMVASCRRKFPGLEFRTANGADLSIFADQSFDAVIMAFNAMDYVIPAESRRRCVQEINRVLTGNGVLIFSSHNPRAILVRPSWNRGRVERMARALARGLPGASDLLLRLLIVPRAAVAWVQAFALSLAQGYRRLFTSAFWTGEGYLFDSAHGGLRTHCAIPESVESEVSEFGFQLERVLGDDYPRASQPYATPWYYYVFRKVGVRGMETCA